MCENSTIKKYAFAWSIAPVVTFVVTWTIFIVEFARASFLFGLTRSNLNQVLREVMHNCVPGPRSKQNSMLALKTMVQAIILAFLSVDVSSVFFSKLALNSKPGLKLGRFSETLKLRGGSQAEQLIRECGGTVMQKVTLGPEFPLSVKR